MALSLRPDHRALALLLASCGGSHVTAAPKSASWLDAVVAESYVEATRVGDSLQVVVRVGAHATVAWNDPTPSGCNWPLGNGTDGHEPCSPILRVGCDFEQPIVTASIDPAHRVVRFTLPLEKLFPDGSVGGVDVSVPLASAPETEHDPRLRVAVYTSPDTGKIMAEMGTFRGFCAGF